MDDICVTRLEKRSWTQDTIEAMERLVAPSGAPEGAVLADELLRCDILYLETGAEGPRAFLLVARVRLPVGAECRDARYVGLSAARDESSCAALMARFTADAQAEAERRRTRLVLFTTTATPVAARAAQTTWSDLQPVPDASFQEELHPVADAARAWLAVDQARGERRLFFCSLPSASRRVPAQAA